MRTAFILTAIAILNCPSAGRAADAVDKANDYLKSIKGDVGVRVSQVKTDYLGKVFPKFTFVAVLYPQFPVGRQPPEPLKPSNVLVIPAGDGKVVPLSDVKEMQKFFAENAANTGKGIEDEVTRAWLRLSAELAQDGFYKFKAPEVTGGAGGSDGKNSFARIDGKIAVDTTGGNKGEIAATVVFKNGVVTKIDHKVKLSPGPRPRCQATKLLDADPIVRQMAEDSIRVMGSACKYYLDEQRAKAAPALQKAIDRVWQRIVDEGR